MAKKQINPTRMELSRLKKKLYNAKRGHKLLKDKRDELMRNFLGLIEENKSLRKKVEKEIKSANQSFLLAKATLSDEVINTALLIPSPMPSIQIRKENIMSIEVPKFIFQPILPFYPYGLMTSSFDLNEAFNSLWEVFPHMLRLAEVEKACMLLSSEIEKTRRRVNALEHVIIPETEANIKYIIMKLDENERSSRVRLMKLNTK